jgi:two-component system NarL family sensor kinase
LQATFLGISRRKLLEMTCNPKCQQNLGTFPFGKQPALSLIQPSEHWLLNSIAVLCLALTIVPVGRWLGERVNDLVYAQDDNPYALIATINRHLQAMTHPDLTLPLVVQSIATTLHFPYVNLELHSGNPPRRYTFGSPPAHTELHQIPILYLNQQLGMLQVAARAVNRPLSDSDRVVLHDIAQQVGIALYVAQLTADLQTSRERLVITREEERRRIRNDLHDGLAPTLSSFQLQLGAIRTLMSHNPDQVEAMIKDLAEDLRQATTEIRRLVYNLRPPMLDELGLIAAIKHIKLSGSTIHLEVLAPEAMPPLSAAVEVAVYRIASEAIHNVVKHAQATICVIEVQVELGYLTLTVTDDGKNPPAGYVAGVGVQSMQERAAELGGTFSIQPTESGGTRIAVRLPLET